MAWGTCGRVNEEIRKKTEKDIARALEDGTLAAALARLDREWDTERVLEANAAASC